MENPKIQGRRSLALRLQAAQASRHMLVWVVELFVIADL
jgi:hypothetical protein